MSEVVHKYQPEACVVQCGADSIVGDPLGGTNLTPEDIGICIERILSWSVPTIFLGGGKSNEGIIITTTVHGFSQIFNQFFIKSLID